MDKARTSNGRTKTGKPKKPRLSKMGYKLFEDELPDLYEQLKRDYEHVEDWLDTPNEALWGERPRDMIGTEKEIHLRDFLRRIRYGLMT